MAVRSEQFQIIIHGSQEKVERDGVKTETTSTSLETYI